MGFMGDQEDRVQLSYKHNRVSRRRRSATMTIARLSLNLGENRYTRPYIWSADLYCQHHILAKH